MLAYLLRRILWVIPTLLGIILIVSIMLETIPGDPVLMMLSETASKEMKEAVRTQLGLDKPFFTRYLSYLGSLVRGDLGRSFLKRDSVNALIGKTFPATVELALGAVAIMILIGLPLGIMSALRPGSIFDFTARGLSLVGVSMPAFWIGLLLVYAFAYRFRWFPLGGRNDTWSLVLPAISLSLSSIGFLMRIVRASMLEILGREYITTARSKGLTENGVIWKHALRNAMLPILTILGLQFGRLLGGAVVTEVVFSWPGMGRLIVDGILTRDYPIVQGAIVVFGMSFVLINLLVDLSYGLLNPTVRYD